MTHYTPNELQNLEIEKSMLRGYKEDVVNEILDKVIEDYNNLIRENVELKDKMAVLNEAMLHYKNIEESLQNTLVIAEHTAEEVRKAAYQKADTREREAELRYQEKINEANDKVLKINYKREELERNLNVYLSKVKTLCLSLIELLGQFSDTKE